jgi:hypothetical protein
MFVVASALCLSIGVFAPRIRDRKLALAAVRGLGGQVYFSFQQTDDDLLGIDPGADPGLPNFLLRTFGEDLFFDAVAVVFSDCTPGNSCRIQGSELARLGGLRFIAFLNADSVSDKCLSEIAHITGLRALLLRNAGRITDKGFASLARLKDLEVLEVSGSLITDDAIEVLRRLPALKQVNFDDNAISDNALFSIAELRRLTFLSLNGTGVTSNGLEHLTALKSLETLFVAETGADTTSLENALPACCVVPSTAIPDEDIRRSLSRRGFERMVERMLRLSRTPNLDARFADTAPALESFLEKLRGAEPWDFPPIEESYKALQALILPKDLGTRLRLAAGRLEMAEDFLAQVEDTEKARQEQRELEMGGTETGDLARAKANVEVLLAQACDNLGLPYPPSTPGVMKVMLTILEGTRPRPTEKQGSDTSRRADK